MSLAVHGDGDCNVFSLMFKVFRVFNPSIRSLEGTIELHKKTAAARREKLFLAKWKRAIRIEDETGFN